MRIPARVPMVLVTLPAVLAAASCTDSEPPQSTLDWVSDTSGAVPVRVADSAGLWVHEYEDAASFPHAIRISEQPIVTIGGTLTDPDTEIPSRPVSINRRSDSTFVLSILWETSLRTFDAEGSRTGTIGRAGRGPGEFDDIVTTCLMPGDALGVVDDGGSRLSVFSPAGIHLHSAPTPVIVDTLAGCLSDGSAVALGKAPRAAAQGYDTTSDVDQDRLVAFTLSQSPELVGVFVPLPQNTLRVQVDGTPIIFMNLPFAPITAVAAAGNVVYYTDGVHSVRILTPELVERGVLRLGSAPEPLSDAVRDRVIDSFAARAPPARQPEIVTAMKSSPNMPSTMPSFRRLLADAAGRLWAQRYRRPDDSVQTWYVFTPDGLAVSQVSVPDDLNVVSIGDDYLAGWSFMEVDGIRVRQVRIYELTSHTP